MSNNAIIISTLDPDNKLIILIKSLIENFKYIIIVNDGSSKDKDNIFKELEHLGCIIIHHKINLGKGQGIKTGIKKLSEFSDITGFITADSDGQHTPEDIMKISNYLDKFNNSIILGTRNFKEKDVPIRSKIGNRFSSLYFFLETNKKCPDTQTGLRAVPIKYAPIALSIEGSRYEYEMNFLLYLAKNNYDIKYCNISTIYENNNAKSHFRTIKDSAIIYRKLLLYTTFSLICALVDISGFTLFKYWGLSIIISTIIARIISGILNFILNKNYSFSSKNNSIKKFAQYTILFITQMLLSGLIVTILSSIQINLIVLKIITDIILYIINYNIQNKYIFK